MYFVHKREFKAGVVFILVTFTVVYACQILYVRYMKHKTQVHLTTRIKYEPPNDKKTTKWHVRPAKTQISLGIHPVQSESSLCAQWVAMDPMFLHADRKD